MQILQVAPRYYPHVGGVERCVQSLSEGLALRGYRVDVVTADLRPGLAAVETIRSVNVYRFRTIGPGDAYYASVGLFRFLRASRTRYHIVHIHGYHAFPALLTAIAGMAGHVILTPYYHGVSDRYHRTVLLKLYKPLGKHLLIRRAVKMVTISPWERERLERDFRPCPGKLELIPCGADVAAIRGSLPYERTGTGILCVGRLTRYKNLELVVESLVHLPQDYHLYVAGSGSDELRLRTITASLNLSDRVTFVGPVTDQELWRWYHTCDVLVSASRLESFGLTALEGLIAGMGVVVNSRSAAAALASMFPDRVRQVELGGRGRAFRLATAISASRRSEHEIDASPFTWDYIVREHMRIYQALIEGKAG